MKHRPREEAGCEGKTGSHRVEQGRAEPGLAKKVSGGGLQAARQLPRGERRGVQYAPVKHCRDSAD